MIIDYTAVGRYGFVFNTDADADGRLRPFVGNYYYDGDWQVAQQNVVLDRPDIELYVHLKPIWAWLEQQDAIFRFTVVSMRGRSDRYYVTAILIEVEETLGPLFRLFWC